MLNVTESVNGKFNIVFSDGYRSQLHDRGKVKTKSDLVTDDAVGNRITKPKIKQQVTQGKPKQNKERANYAKVTKPSKLAAKFNGKLPDNNERQTRSNNKPKPTVQKSSVDGSDSANETSAYVTKNDLAKLLETLTGTNSKNVSATRHEAQLGSIAPIPSEKISQPTKATDAVKTEEANVNENVKVSGMFSNEQESIKPVVKENNREENIASTAMKETIKPAAMRSSFAIGAPGLVTNNPDDDKAAKHRQWVKELEQQIQEKKEKEKQIKRNQSVDISPQIETRRTGNFFNKQNNENYPVKSTIGATTQLQQETDRSNTGHARGRGLMSMLSESETDKQRKKITEHQKAIELQVEDRRRQKMEERELRLREEAIENERVAKEREKLQKQFGEEIIKMKENEEQAKRRVHVLQEGISKAFESAQQLKRDKRKNRMQESTTEVVTVKASYEDDNINGKTNRQQTILPDDNRRLKPVVPPLNLRTSISPVNKLDKSNEKFSSRLSDSTLNVKRNSLCVRDVRTSYSEADKDRSDTLINKWVNEDFGSLITNRDLNYDGHLGTHLSSEVIVPFHRTASATLFRESLASQEVHESRGIDKLTEANGNLTDRKVVKKGRSVPEVQPTRTSRLREKRTDNKNASLTSRRKKHGVDKPQQTVQKPKPQITSPETSDERITNKYKNVSSISEENQMTNIPSHLLATFTPTAHQEKILEQLATLRKGLVMKDQEIETRVFQITEYEIQA